MTTLPAAVVALAVLSAAGCLPVLALVGARFVAVPLAPLAGAVIAALASTGYVAFGGTFMGWFVGLAVVAGGGVTTLWHSRPDWRPAAPQQEQGTSGRSGHGATGAIGFVAVVAACAWSLRGLSSPTVGFDARSVWLLRSGWFLQSHSHLLTNLTSLFSLPQDGYPPLVSAAGSVAWSVTGNDSLRLGVVVVAILNTCALAAAAFALVDTGRRCAVARAKLQVGDTRVPGATPDVPLLPLLVGGVTGVLLVVIAFGITEPFMTNGYADPTWSLSALGAVVFGLQMPIGRSESGAAFILVLMAGMSKNEGALVAVILIALICLRGLTTMSAADRHRRWWRPVVIAAVEVAAIGVWPLAMRVVHTVGQSNPIGPADEMLSRANATAHGLAPYLHSLLWAAPVALIGGLVLPGLRRQGGAANDWWAWTALVSGLLVIGGTLVLSPAAIGPLLRGSQHRLTEFPALLGWWIVATWAVLTSGSSWPAHLKDNKAPGAPRPQLARAHSVR
jgi:hypothetical protein